MKQVLAIVTLALILTVSSAGLALGAEKTFTYDIAAELRAGYLDLPGYTFSEPDDVYDDGAFFANLSSLRLRLDTNITITDQYSAFLISQFEMYQDGNDDSIDNVCSPVADYGIIYNPGIVKLTYDAKGRDVMIGIKDEELLKLNVARRYVTNSIDPDGDPKIYRYYDYALAKQLTVEAPFSFGRGVAVISLEPTSDGAGQFVGGFIEVPFDNGQLALGYQAKMDDEFYTNTVPAGYFVLAAEYDFSDSAKLQLDYSTRDDGGDGYTAYFKPVSELEQYDATPFLVKQHLNSKLTVGNYGLNLRLLNFEHYWLDVSYRMAPYTFGLNYRDWAFAEEGSQAQSDEYVAEFYGKRSLKADRKDYLKAFYRTDKSFGASVTVFFE